MKRILSMFFAVLLLFTCVITDAPEVYAASGNGETRTISIVFDNSGSMYEHNNMAWCRATYAMEVFASMLNEGDTLLVYPMHPITTGGQEYTMDNPLRVTDAAQAPMIREIYSPKTMGTPIETIERAAEDLLAMQAENKHLIVLTDGDNFSVNGTFLGTGSKTAQKLGECFDKYACGEIPIMYLGIGRQAADPRKDESDCFIKRQAAESEDVLATLTELCNQIFGRDTLPEDCVSNNTVKFDISMKKLIVFVQGADVSDVQLNGANGAAGQMISSASTKYGTLGSGTDGKTPDETLQGMMVTYTDCPAGSYTLDYTGEVTSIEVYYEPDADLDFVFTDKADNKVDPNSLYEGDYKVSFGMKDAKTGELISSELLGNPSYKGAYFVGGEEHEIKHNGFSGEVPVSLKMKDTFDANLTVTYLGGYTITKTASDFGWPEGGITVAARPAGEMRLEISGGQAEYSLENLTEGVPFIAKVFYSGTQLTGKELKSVDLMLDKSLSNADIQSEFADDHFVLSLHHKDAEVPQNTVCGECTVSISASYTEKGSNEARAESSFSYSIIDDSSPFDMTLNVAQDYIVISELGNSAPITVGLSFEGENLPPEDFAAVGLAVDCGGIEYQLTPNEQNSSYVIQLKPTDGIEAGEYPVKVTARYIDRIGRESVDEDAQDITLSGVPLWVKWMVSLLLFLLLLLLIWMILRIKVFPKSIAKNQPECSMSVNGEDVTQNTTFKCERTGKDLRVEARYAGDVFGLTMSVRRGKEAYLMKPSKKRRIEIQPITVKKKGVANIKDATVGNKVYEIDSDTGKLLPVDQPPKPFEIGNGANIEFSGNTSSFDDGDSFYVNIKLLFK